jgi:hypothetical protein
MSEKLEILKLTLCGPGDVQKEIDLAREVISDWNHKHSEAERVILKEQHWKTDAYPDASERGQGVINRQLIDKSDVLIGIFWSRFGTPTGLADSGTEEEILRGIKAGKYVAVYFSELEPLPSGTSAEQLRRLNEFRTRMMETSLSWPFRSRANFVQQFGDHLVKIVRELKPRERSKKKGKIVQQKVGRGNSNVLIAGDGNTVNHYTKPPGITIKVTPPPDSITPSQRKQIQRWIEALVDKTTNKTKAEAFQSWWETFKNTFDIEKYESLPQSDFPRAKAWFIKQKAILTRGLKRKDPRQWEKARFGAIKAAMTAMRRTKEDYYPELALRLKIKPFTSLKQLTKTNLDRVYNMVRNDQK